MSEDTANFSIVERITANTTFSSSDLLNLIAFATAELVTRTESDLAQRVLSLLDVNATTREDPFKEVDRPIPAYLTRSKQSQGQSVQLAPDEGEGEGEGNGQRRAQVRAKPKAKSKPKSRSKPMGVPVFMDPNDNSRTWSGHGKKPRWLAEYIEQGAELDDFRIGVRGGFRVDKTPSQTEADF